MERDGENKSGKPAGLRLLTKKDVARLPACSIRMVERLVASGTLTAVKIRGAVRFRSSDIEQIGSSTFSVEYRERCLGWRHRVSIPTGLDHSAQGCAPRATLGENRKKSQPCKG